MTTAANPMRRASNALRRWGPALVIAALVAVAAGNGLLRPLDDGLATLRFDILRREPSRTLTVVEIDAASLRAAGRWPWGRERFAQAIDNLEAAGAQVVAFDVDFSTVSSPEADRRLKEAINRKPGSVVLPTFIQPASSAPGAGLIETSPLAALSADALVASVNVPVDSDGRVRRYDRGVIAADGYRPSIGSLLAEVGLPWPSDEPEDVQDAVCLVVCYLLEEGYV